MRGLTLGDPALLGGLKPPFDPLSLSPYVWLDASDLTTITSSSGKCSEWRDRSGNGRRVVQGAAAAQPGTGVVTQNGLNVLTFDGDDSMTAITTADWSFLHDGTVYLIAYVMTCGNVANPGVEYGLLSTLGTTGGVGYFAFSYTDTNPTTINDRLLHAVGTPAAGPNVIFQRSLNNAAAANVPHIGTLLAAPASVTLNQRSQIAVNNGALNATNGQSAAPSIGAPPRPLTLGGLVDGVTARLVGRMMEIIIVRGANATEANRVALRDYLNAKWAVY